MNTRPEAAHISTGRLPPVDVVQKLVAEAYEHYRSNPEGESSQVHPALARVPRDLFGICVVGTTGNVFAVGDADHEFAIMSVSKPFVFALVCEALGHDQIRQKIGVNATGLAFNSLAAIERGDDGRTNPMVNTGAIATTSLVPGADLAARWQLLHEGLSHFAGRKLSLNEEVYASASATNHRNQSIARLLQSYGRTYLYPAEATDLYAKQCSLNVSARPGGYGRDTSRRRGEPSDPRARGGCVRLPLRAGRDDDRGARRNLRRLVVQHWFAGKKQYRERHRHRLAGQGRAGNVRPAAQQGQQ
jgi:glutaminase